MPCIVPKVNVDFGNMSKPSLIVGLIVLSDSCSLAAQEMAMGRAKISPIYYDVEACVLQRRRGSCDVVAVYRAMLLAGKSSKRKPGSLRASFRANLDKLEDAGATVLELDTGRSSADPRQRDLMIRDAEDKLGRVRRYSRAGRPARVWSKGALRVMRLHWFGKHHATNRAAVEAMVADGVMVSASQVYKALGKSGRTRGPKR